MLIFILIAFFILIFLNLQIAEKGYEDFLSYENTVALRGICAIEIVLGHIGIVLSKELLLFPF